MCSMYSLGHPAQRLVPVEVVIVVQPVEVPTCQVAPFAPGQAALLDDAEQPVPHRRGRPPTCPAPRAASGSSRRSTSSVTGT